ncbi:SDR family NAD(P)-dependent oxidoreductase [Polaromonas sp. SM01]|uniref:SDR family NAD(P)-dependent oxidoreductase n=1 Tax=Polaromonas sp. SM01 TaxID=3085630 RepID=UPI002980D5F7|nr:SDR family NAD(P)-dependent oxidoreductase [Polaromonas sp. SM01]MDW5443477.1 SDR family NAD(P)-dependent oxidoreductase [Polaromonas sp. SM01]
MTQHLFILTGASRGMGLAMARKLLIPGNTLLCISRKTNDTLAAQAQMAGTALLQWSEDLANSVNLSARLEQWLREQVNAGFSSAVLINNAGVVPRISPLSDADADDLRQALSVGLEAPMQLSSAFLRATESWSAKRKVLNISSGLGRKPMASQTAYCAAKAGMDHFTRCLALEEALKPNGAAVCSLAPGIIDTDMQVQLRSADTSVFPDQGNFLQLKSKGLLSSPEDAASQVLAYLARPDFGSQPVADVRD